jgi:hypothetical protein
MEIKMVLFVSCYTDVYKEEAMGLIKTLNDFKLNHRVEELPTLGNWNLNTKLKTTWIQKMLNDQDQPVVWLDADARVLKHPELFFTLQDKTDFGCHMRRGKELLSGTLYFNNNDITKQMVEEWIEVNKRKPNVFDQRNLHDVIRKHEKTIRWNKLPAAYCLFDLIVRQEGVKEDTAVIWHRQASRRLKRLANKRR